MFDSTLEKAIALHAGGELQNAELLYRALLEIRPDQPEANHNLGLMALADGDIEEALERFVNAIQANPKVESYWFSYIEGLIKAERFTEAAETLSDIQQAGVTAPELDELRERLESEPLAMVAPSKAAKPSSDRDGAKPTGSPDRSIAVSEVGPSTSRLAEVVKAFNAGRFAETEKLAKRLTEEFPNHEMGWKALGAALNQTGRLEDALVAMKEAVQSAPFDAEAHFNLGCCHNDLGRPKEAEVCFRRSIEILPEYAQAHCNLSSALCDLFRFSEAAQSGRRAVFLDCNSPEAHCNLGNALMGQNKYEEAEACYRKALALKFEFAEAHNNLGGVLKDLGRLEEAENSFSQAIELKPGYKAALLGRSKVRFELGKLSAAVEDAYACDTEESRAQALVCLYAMERHDEIYRQIEHWARSDRHNIRMAAVAAFMSERLGKATAHDFCQRPMSFVHTSNLASHIQDSDVFVSDLIEELQGLATTWEPRGKSTHNGFQLTGDKHLFEQPSTNFKKLETIIHAELDRYLLRYGNQKCALIQDWPEQKALQGWHVVLKRQGYQEPHIHPRGWVSGVIYLKVVPGLDNHEGAIEFSLSSKNYSDLNSPSSIYQPSNGDIVLFPSSLHHRTIPFSVDSERITIAFDLLPPTSKFQDEDEPEAFAPSPSSLPKVLQNSEEKNSCLSLDSNEHIDAVLKLLHAGKMTRAEELSRTYVQKYPLEHEGWSMLGVSLKYAGKALESLKALKKVVDMRPNDADAHNNLAVTYRDLGQLPEAEASYRRAIQIRPDFADAYVNLGNTLKELGDRPGATLNFTKAIELQPDSANAHYKLGILLYEAHQYREAAAEFKFADTEASEAYWLKCSYALDDENTFFQNLDAFSRKRQTNAIIGSLSSCAQIKYGRIRPNPFCNEPLQHVREIDLLGQTDFQATFRDPIQRVLSEDIRLERSQNLLRNGIQTAGNIFSHREIVGSDIEVILRKEIDKYRTHFVGSTEGFIRNWPSSYRLLGWLIDMQSGGALAPHMHEHSWISGSVYINVPPKSERNSGNLVLCAGDQESDFTARNPDERVVDVKTGSLCFFPSSLHHYTVPFTSSESRVVLAFDVIPA